MNAYYSPEALDSAAELLRAIAHPTRIKILDLMMRHQPIHVNQIYNKLKLEQSITSQHLKVLRDSRLVDTRREGKFIFYTPNIAKIHQILDASGEFVTAGKTPSVKKNKMVS